MKLTYDFSSPQNIEIILPSSKSISNRVLIINSLSQNKANLHRLSSARDTQTMQRLLSDENPEWDALDAGTVFRFLTAFLSISGKEKVLTGTERMKQRPIGDLVQALLNLGAKIEYIEKENYPPLRINGANFQQITNKISIRGDISSQYISALLMIAPILPNGLSIQLTGELRSLPYIEMTLGLLQTFGIQYHKKSDREIEVPSQAYLAPLHYDIEGDWSAASYAYSIVALSENITISLPYLSENSLQGDSKIAEWMLHFGVKTTFFADKIEIHFDKDVQKLSPLFLDFSHQPDLAQTIVVIAAAKNIPLKLTGLHSLRIKETDRIVALQAELAKFGVKLEETETDIFSLSGTFQQADTTICTYEDHRMAMAFAPLAFLGNINILEPEVVVKSYPDFWRDIQVLGFEVLGQ
jgi:3-phosphoshikimate 1-carboxyvinyltransferase